MKPEDVRELASIKEEMPVDPECQSWVHHRVWALFTDFYEEDQVNERCLALYSFPEIPMYGAVLSHFQVSVEAEEEKLHSAGCPSHIIEQLMTALASSGGLTEAEIA